MIKKLYFLVLLPCIYTQGKPVLVVQSKEPKIFIIKNLLSDAECNHMINIAKPNLKRSKIVEATKEGTVDSRRTSRGFYFDEHSNNKMTKAIEKRIAKLTNMPVQNGEPLQILHYAVGGEYQPHYDYFDETTTGGCECLRDGGQRVISIVIYLNTPEEGGKTIFPHANVSITPKKGDAVLFYNCTQDGVVDPNTLHGGSPVLKGEKWIMTKWIREKEFKKG